MIHFAPANYVKLGGGRIYSCRRKQHLRDHTYQFWSLINLLNNSAEFSLIFDTGRLNKPIYPLGGLTKEIKEFWKMTLSRY